MHNVPFSCQSNQSPSIFLVSISGDVSSSTISFSFGDGYDVEILVLCVYFDASELTLENRLISIWNEIPLQMALVTIAEMEWAMAICSA